jgi:hypothetical protein
MKRKQFLVLHIAINIGVLAGSILVYFGGVPITRVLLIALFTAIVMNGAGWAMARSYARKHDTDSHQVAIVGEDISGQLRRFRLLGYGLIACGIFLGLLGLWTGPDEGRPDVTALCLGGIVLAPGIFLLVYSSRKRR